MLAPAFHVVNVKLAGFQRFERVADMIQLAAGKDVLRDQVLFRPPFAKSPRERPTSFTIMWGRRWRRFATFARFQGSVALYGASRQHEATARLFESCGMIAPL
jgi:hypothetical protein